jgi:hypothetical protein
VTRVSATSFHLQESLRPVDPSGPQQAAIERAESQLEEGAHLIAKQKQQIAEMLADSLDVRPYREALAHFEEMHRQCAAFLRLLKQQFMFPGTAGNPHRHRRAVEGGDHFSAAVAPASPIALI